MHAYRQKSPRVFRHKMAHSLKWIRRRKVIADLLTYLVIIAIGAFCLAAGVAAFGAPH